MTNALKEFIEHNIDLIDNNEWKKLFIKAYDECLLTSEVQDLHHMLLTLRIVDSTNIRNELLFEYLNMHLDFVRSKYKVTPDDIRVIDTYAVQFLRYYMNNTFGFYEGQVLQYMWENQKELGIMLEKASRAPGQGSIDNYMIHFEN